MQQQLQNQASWRHTRAQCHTGCRSPLSRTALAAVVRFHIPFNKPTRVSYATNVGPVIRNSAESSGGVRTRIMNDEKPAQAKPVAHESQGSSCHTRAHWHTGCRVTGCGRNFNDSPNGNTRSSTPAERHPQDGSVALQTVRGKRLRWSGRDGFTEFHSELV